MDAGAFPIGAQNCSSARYGRIRYRAEVELRAPDGRGQCSRAGCANRYGLFRPGVRGLKSTAIFRAWSREVGLVCSDQAQESFGRIECFK